LSVIGYREWQIWTNMDFCNSGTDVHGVAYFKITPSLMAEQTIGFIYEKIEQIRNGQAQYEDNQLKNYFDLSWITRKRSINPTFSPGRISGTIHGVGTAI